MKTNIGSTDKVVRLLLAVISIVVFATNVVTGTWAWVILAAGIILGVTALINFCPIWAAFGVNTSSK